jgi:type IV secretory pathway TrbF-like protein
MTTPDRINRGLAGVRIAIALVGLTLAVLAVIAVLWVTFRSPAVPKFQIVAKQGMVLSIVVDESVAASDSALLKIADALVPTMPGRAVQLHVWTDARLVPQRVLDATDAQMAARRAMVTINLNTGVRSVEGRAK